ncbi:unnamed protein product, partial [Chrysoparadoxa australica]
GERGKSFQEQLGMPKEEDLNSWSHHYSTDTVDDPVFKAAMAGTDESLVSFVFGLEVTWDLLEMQLAQEAEAKALEEEKKAQAAAEKAELKAKRAAEGLMSSQDHDAGEDVALLEPEPEAEAEADTEPASAKKSERKSKGRGKRKRKGKQHGLDDSDVVAKPSKSRKTKPSRKVQ